MSKSNSFLFMPDISGFTKFIHETEIRHSQHIISELLEIMIDSNELGMELAEIEGDALFYYSYRTIPDFNSLLNQVKNMYLKFHHHLQLYEKKRICQCGACSSASKLELKFVAHAGLFSFINVKGKQKPIGPDVITIHRLLKNKAKGNEYLLVTGELINCMNISSLSDEWKSEESSYDGLDPVVYHYKEISQFRKELPDLPEIVVDSLDEKYRLRMQVDIERSVLDVYELITNFNLRGLWNKDVDRMIYDENEINQINSKHTCVINNKEINFSTISQTVDEGKWVYGEQTNDVPFMSTVNTYFILAPVGENTQLLIDTYFKPKGLIGKILFPVLRKEFGKNVSKGIKLIKEVSESYNATEMYQLVEAK